MKMNMSIKLSMQLFQISIKIMDAIFLNNILSKVISINITFQFDWIAILISFASLYISIMSYRESKINNIYSHYPRIHPLPTNFKVHYKVDDKDPFNIKFQRVGPDKDGSVKESKILDFINLQITNIGKGVATNISLEWDEYFVTETLRENIKKINHPKLKYTFIENKDFYLIENTYQGVRVNGRTFLKLNTPLKAHNLCYPNSEENLLLYLPDELNYLIKIRLHTHLFDIKYGFPFHFIIDETPLFSAKLVFNDVYGKKMEPKKIHFFFIATYDPELDYAILNLHFHPNILY